MLRAAERRLEFCVGFGLISALGMCASCGRGVAGAKSASASHRTAPTTATTETTTKESRLRCHATTEANKPTDSNAAEVTTHDTAPTFKVRVNEVLVRVVVRDESGKVIPNLKKEDFQLFDNRKPQTITSFRVETPETNRGEGRRRSRRKIRTAARRR